MLVWPSHLDNNFLPNQINGNIAKFNTYVHSQFQRDRTMIDRYKLYIRITYTQYIRFWDSLMFACVRVCVCVCVHIRMLIEKSHYIRYWKHLIKNLNHISTRRWNTHQYIPWLVTLPTVVVCLSSYCYVPTLPTFHSVTAILRKTSIFSNTPTSIYIIPNRSVTRTTPHNVNKRCTIHWLRIYTNSSTIGVCNV